MIPYEIWFTIQEKLSNTNPYYMSDEFLNWIKFKHYPILSWTQETLPFEKLTQYNLNATIGKWSLPSISKQFLYPRICDKTCLTSQEPYIYLIYQGYKQGWILFNVKQAGKYVSRN